MKKIFLSAAILAAFASCSKNEVTDMPQANQIAFTSLNSNVTKVANDLTGDAAVDYKVYANIVKGTTVPTGWLINDVVDGVTNLAGQTYFWPLDAEESVSFYAYAPSPLAVPDASLSETCPLVTFNYTVPATAQEDFTIAEPLLNQVSTTSDETAKLQFSHQLSKVTVTVQLTEDLTNAGYALETGYESAITVFENSAAVNVSTKSFTPAAANTTTLLAAYDEDDTNMYYIMPQATKGCKIQLQNIEVKHTASGSSLFGGVVDLEEIVLAETAMGGSDFVTGKHYVVTVTVGGGSTTEDGDTPPVIKFSATDAGWGTDVPAGVTQG